MRKIYLTCISVMMLMAACQKETAQVKNAVPNASGVVNSSTINGVSMIKDGYPYPNIQTASGFADDQIGWFIDLNAVQNGFTGGPILGPVNSLEGEWNYCGGIQSVTLFAGQNIAMGTLNYANDATNLYVEYTTNPDWYMSEIHLYVGSLSGSPKSGGGTPSPGRFPIKSSFNASNLSQSIAYTIPLANLPAAGFIIAAHASVLRVDIDGDVIAKETAWAAGTRFTSNKNWATYVTGSLGTCGGGGAGDLTNNNNSSK